MEQALVLSAMDLVVFFLQLLGAFPNSLGGRISDHRLRAEPRFVAGLMGEREDFGEP